MFAGYITRLRDNYLALVLVAWELAPHHYPDKKTWWLPSHPLLEEVLAVAYIKVPPRSSCTPAQRPCSFHLLPFVNMILV